MKFDYKKFLPHIGVILLFIIASIVYFLPMLKGKKLHGSDIKQSLAMSSQSQEFNKTHEETTYWMENAFGGMPTYLNRPNYPNLFVKKISKTLQFLSYPASFLFIGFLSFYLFLLSVRVNYKLAAIGALAFGLSTFFMVSIEVGHWTKVVAISYMPAVLAGIICVFRQKFIWGGLLLTISAALEIGARHFQITYYLLLAILIIGVIYLYKAIKNKTLPQYFKSIAVMVAVGILAFGANISNILATQEYSDFSTRGESGLTITSTGEKREKQGMSYDYITSYSYGIAETMNLFIPKFMGGASVEKLGRDSNAYKSLANRGVQPQQALQFLKNAPTYWGDQPYTAAPNYIGAVIIFLFILSLFLVHGRLKWWVVASCSLALPLSWGDNLEFLTRFFIDYVPFYGKFRTVAMIQVIIQMLVPFLALLGVSKLFSKKIDEKEKLYALKWAALISAGICVFFLIFKTSLFDFVGARDGRLQQQVGPEFIEALKQDRIAMLNTDTFRTLIFVLLAAGTLFAYLKMKLNKNLCMGILAVLILVDLIGVDQNYVNYDDFSYQKQSSSYQPTEADKKIMSDKGHFRVFDLSAGNPMSSARASAFHNSIGGYSGAKPGRYQELYDFYIGQGNQQVLNMLNVKYFITSQQGENPVAQKNPNAFGNAWFVDKVKFVNSVNAEMRNLDSVNLKNTAVINSKFKELIPKTNFQNHPEDKITLESSQANKLVYNYSLKEDRVAVFSENYYPHGWEISTENEELKMAQANYVLRAVYLPAGNHKLTFKFEPGVIKLGSTITLISGILMGLFLLGGIAYSLNKNKQKTENQ